jgi:ABC-type uncharacterized transport system permease subunit
MNTKNRILTGIAILMAAAGLMVLTSSAPKSSSGNEAKEPTPSCSKVNGNECAGTNSNGEFIHESLSRQFLFIAPVNF